MPRFEMPVERFDWPAIGVELDAFGAARLDRLLDEAQCAEVAGFWEEDRLFRQRIVMAKHGYGAGEYRYFAYPLPPLVQGLRERLWPPLAVIANRWRAALGENERLPDDLAAYLRRCHAAGQTRPTPLLLDYGPGDFNRLHQDLYGEAVFPLQVAVLLNAPGEDFVGGEFVLTEQRARMQSRPEVVDLKKGDGVVFAVSARPGTGPRGPHRLVMRHGVSRIHSGHRRTLGIIFHDAG